MWTEHESALVEQERRRVLQMLPEWFKQSDGIVEVEEVRCRSGSDDIRLYVVATYRELSLSDPLARRQRLGCRVEVVPIRPAYDGGMVGPVGSFVWALKQAVRFLQDGAVKRLGFDTGWTVPDAGHSDEA